MAVRALPKQPAPPRLRVVRGVEARRRLSVRLVLALVAIVFAVTVLQAIVGQQGLRIAELEREVRRAEERMTLLRARQAQLTEPARVAEEAVRIGLVSDADPTFLRAPAPEPTPDPSSEAQASRRLLHRKAP